MTRWWLYDLILYAYALSLLFHFADVAGDRRGAKNMGLGLLVFVWLLQTLFFVHRLWQIGIGPIFSWFETIFMLSWLLVSISLTMRLQKQRSVLLLGLNMIAFTLLAAGRFASGDGAAASQGFGSYGWLLAVHIAVALGSYASFTVSAIASVLYIYLFRRLKDKRWSSFLKRLPGLEQVERLNSRSTAAGVGLLACSLAIGMAGLVGEGQAGSSLDWKTVLSLALLAGYGWQFVQRRRRVWSGLRLAVWNVSMYAMLGLNFIVSNRLSDWHRWQ
ncbi:inner membrane protein YpjD [Paenibacillus thermoaerophilus]|uniref:Inner membrane protein YpjD n=1 Tax=Paenibacillus thermoaerophilus TaxID=1215385 RepID=A0ABW2V8D1_9BACL|nr:cytochrome c biogenesis protein CcsA [Paenibacillus thermoaerophilus]TMV11087.1 cytochrome C assembly protein [Paenibacillus thermoaerophilus]